MNHLSLNFVPTSFNYLRCFRVWHLRHRCWWSAHSRSGQKDVQRVVWRQGHGARRCQSVSMLVIWHLSNVVTLSSITRHTSSGALVALHNSYYFSYCTFYNIFSGLADLLRMGEHGFVAVHVFRPYCKTHQALLTPVFTMQQKLKNATLGKLYQNNVFAPVWTSLYVFWWDLSCESILELNRTTLEWTNLLGT